jgi:hypothetical protein
MSFGNFLQFLNCRDFKRFRVKAYSPDTPTVFLHIPKTSGTALTLGLADAIAPRNSVCHGMGQVLFGSFEDFSSRQRSEKPTISRSAQPSSKRRFRFGTHLIFDTLPAFHLIEPGAACRDEMKMDLGMGFEPAILLGFMRIEIVQHNVNLFVRIFDYQLVHEIQKGCRRRPKNPPHRSLFTKEKGAKENEEPSPLMDKSAPLRPSF